MKQLILSISLVLVSFTLAKSQISVPVPICGVYNFEDGLTLPAGKNLIFDATNTNDANKFRIRSSGGTATMEFGQYLFFTPRFNNNSTQAIFFERNINSNRTILHIGNRSVGDGRFSFSYYETSDRTGDAYISNRGGVIYIAPQRTDAGGIHNGKPVAVFNSGGLTTRGVTILPNHWSDFVFAADYKLPSLSEVKAHIQQHKHLPDIPSEAEVIANGIDLGEMQAKLLQKIEELTLYAIQQQELIDSMQEKLEQLETQLK